MPNACPNTTITVLNHVSLLKCLHRNPRNKNVLFAKSKFPIVLQSFSLENSLTLVRKNRNEKYETYSLERKNADVNKVIPVTIVFYTWRTIINLMLQWQLRISRCCLSTYGRRWCSVSISIFKPGKKDTWNQCNHTCISHFLLCVYVKRLNCIRCSNST